MWRKAVMVATYSRSRGRWRSRRGYGGVRCLDRCHRQRASPHPCRHLTVAEDAAFRHSADHRGSIDDPDAGDREQDPPALRRVLIVHYQGLDVGINPFDLMGLVTSLSKAAATTLVFSIAQPSATA